MTRIKQYRSSESADNTGKVTTLGMECYGTIVRIGDHVTEFSIGDKVSLIAQDCCQRYVTVNLDEASASYSYIRRVTDKYRKSQKTAPVIAYATALSALRDTIRLQPGETVFIHGSDGSIGSAMVNVARYLGAKIIVTCDSDEKRDYFEALNVDHVIENHTLDFKDKVSALTCGQGVNAAVNFDSGSDTINACMQTLGRFGRFVEIGRLNHIEDKVMPAVMFDKAITYNTLEIDGFIEHENDYVTRLADDVWQLTSQGQLPLLSTTVFTAEKTSAAFDFVTSGKSPDAVVLDLSQVPEVSMIRSKQPALTAGKNSPDHRWPGGSRFNGGKLVH